MSFSRKEMILFGQVYYRNFFVGGTYTQKSKYINYNQRVEQSSTVSVTQISNTYRIQLEFLTLALARALMDLYTAEFQISMAHNTG